MLLLPSIELCEAKGDLVQTWRGGEEGGGGGEEGGEEERREGGRGEVRGGEERRGKRTRRGGEERREERGMSGHGRKEGGALGLGEQGGKERDNSEGKRKYSTIDLSQILLHIPLVCCFWCVYN